MCQGNPPPQGCIRRAGKWWPQRRLEEVVKVVGAVTVGYKCH